MPDSAAHLAYLVGFFDGEGCVSVGQKSGLVISAGQTKIEPLLLLEGEFGGKVRKQESKHPRRKDMYHWTLSRGSAALALERMLLFLVVKRDQAIVGSNLQGYFSENPKRKLTEDQRSIRQAMIDTVSYLKHGLAS